MGVRNMAFPEAIPKHTATHRILDQFTNKGRHAVVCPFKTLKDSLDLVLVDRVRLADWCLKHSPLNRMCIVHGTSTMLETAEFLATRMASMPALERTIVLTGASQPHSQKVSDAEFNLGSAIAAVKILPPGVYIAMHGEVLAWNECVKDPKTGMFQHPLLSSLEK